MHTSPAPANRSWWKMVFMMSWIISCMHNSCRKFRVPVWLSVRLCIVITACSQYQSVFDVFRSGETEWIPRCQKRESRDNQRSSKVSGVKHACWCYECFIFIVYLSRTQLQTLPSFACVLRRLFKSRQCFLMDQFIEQQRYLHGLSCICMTRDEIVMACSHCYYSYPHAWSSLVYQIYVCYLIRDVQ